MLSISKDSKRANTLNREISSEGLLSCRPTKVAHSLSKDVRLQKTCKCARPLIARICLNDDPIKREYKRPLRDRGQ